MAPHSHLNATAVLFVFAAVVATFGSLHLLSLTQDSRFSRAFLTLGF